MVIIMQAAQRDRERDSNCMCVGGGGDIADCSFNVNSNGQCIPQNYVLDEQIFINI